MNIPLGIEGRVVNSDHPEHVVRVQDDKENTGGFLIYQRWNGSNGPNPRGEFDDWVESSESLGRYFTESGWSVEWNQ